MSSQAAMMPRTKRLVFDWACSAAIRSVGQSGGLCRSASAGESAFTECAESRDCGCCLFPCIKRNLARCRRSCCLPSSTLPCTARLLLQVVGITCKLAQITADSQAVVLSVTQRLLGQARRPPADALAAALADSLAASLEPEAGGLQEQLLRAYRAAAKYHPSPRKVGCYQDRSF
jgi:hypothetical protein